MEVSQLNHLREQQEQQEKRLRSWASLDWCVQLLCTIPGVGRPTAEVIVAYVDDPHRFKMPPRFLRMLASFLARTVAPEPTLG